MKAWNKIFKTLGFFWLLFCLVTCTIAVVMCIDAAPIYAPVNVIGWTIGWYVGDILIKVFKNKLGSIWFDKWETGILN